MTDVEGGPEPVCSCPPGSLSNLCGLHAPLTVVAPAAPAPAPAHPLRAQDVPALIAKQIG